MEDDIRYSRPIITKQNSRGIFVEKSGQIPPPPTPSIQNFPCFIVSGICYSHVHLSLYLHVSRPFGNKKINNIEITISVITLCLPKQSQFHIYKPFIGLRKMGPWSWSWSWSRTSLVSVSNYFLGLGLPGLGLGLGLGLSGLGLGLGLGLSGLDYNTENRY